MYGYVCLWMAMYGTVRLCIYLNNLYGHLWLVRTSIYIYIYTRIYIYIPIYLFIYTYSKTHVHIRWDILEWCIWWYFPAKLVSHWDHGYRLDWWGFPLHALWRSPIHTGGMTPSNHQPDFLQLLHLLSWVREAHFANGARSFRCNVSEHVRDHPLRKVVGLGESFSLEKKGHLSELLGIIMVVAWES